MSVLRMKDYISEAFQSYFENQTKPTNQTKTKTKQKANKQTKMADQIRSIYTNSVSYVLFPAIRGPIQYRIRCHRKISQSLEGTKSGVKLLVCFAIWQVPRLFFFSMILTKIAGHSCWKE